MSNHRQTHRVNFDSFVEFTTSDCRYICELVDISIQGALISACSGATPDAGTECQLIISLDDDKINRIIMNGVVARKFENQIGIQCESIDSDSMAHLRKLVEYNLGDVELVNREFESIIMHE